LKKKIDVKSRKNQCKPKMNEYDQIVTSKLMLLNFKKIYNFKECRTNENNLKS